MAENVGQTTKERMLDRLVTTAQELSPAQIAEVSDFAEFLRSKSTGFPRERGSAEAILDALERVGPLEFEPGELEQLMAEIQADRDRGYE